PSRDTPSASPPPGRAPRRRSARARRRREWRVSASHLSSHPDIGPYIGDVYLGQNAFPCRHRFLAVTHVMKEPRRVIVRELAQIERDRAEIDHVPAMTTGAAILKDALALVELRLRRFRPFLAGRRRGRTGLPCIGRNQIGVGYIRGGCLGVVSARCRDEGNACQQTKANQQKA